MPTKKALKEKILEEITEKFIEKIIGMVNQNLKMYPRNFSHQK
jgi:hypothetical protein